MKPKLLLNLSMKFKNSFYVFIVLLIGIAVCVSVWFFLREHRIREFQEQSQPTRPNNGIAVDDQPSSQPSQNPDGSLAEEQLTAEEKIARHNKSTFKSMRSAEELAIPRVQKLLEAMDSPEYLEYLKDMRLNGPSYRKWNDFLESQGLPVKRGYLERFRKYFPMGEPEDYEPEMRLKIAKLFLAAEPVNLTDPLEAARQRVKVVGEFKDKDELHRPWFFGHFGENGWNGHGLIEREGVESNPALVWVADVQRNAASIVAQAEQARGESSESQVSAPSWDLSSVMESPPVSSDATTGESQSIFPPVPDGLAPPAISKPETDAAATPTQGLTDVPKASTALPTVEELEAVLKSQFSSERFERAMSTLDRYGPKEGLRRLRENDLEVAKQIEQYRNRSRSEDSDKSEEVSR